MRKWFVVKSHNLQYTVWQHTSWLSSPIFFSNNIFAYLLFFLGGGWKKKITEKKVFHFLLFIITKFKLGDFLKKHFLFLFVNIWLIFQCMFTQKWSVFHVVNTGKVSIPCYIYRIKIIFCFFKKVSWYVKIQCECHV